MVNISNWEYVHKDEVATLILEQQRDSSYATYMNPCCCRLFHVPYPVSTPLDIEPLISSDMNERLHDIMNQLNEIYTVYQFVHRIDTNECTIPFFIRIISLCDPNHKRFLCYCHELISENTVPVSMFENEVNRQFYNATFDGIFTLQVTSDQNILLVDYNKAFSLYFGIKEDESQIYNIQSLVSPYIEEFFRTNINIAYSKDSSHTSLLEYQCTDIDEKYQYASMISAFHVLISFIPLRQPDGSKRILCSGKNISVELKDKNETRALLEEYNALFHNTVNATCILSCRNPYQPDLIRMNPAMKQLIKEFPQLLEVFPNHFEQWFELLETQQTTEGIMTLENKKNIRHFKLVLVPIMRNTHLERVIVSLIDTTYQVNKNLLDSIHLTPREEEVIQHVITGEKNDFIARQLCVSVGTIKRTLSNAYSKLGISSRVELFNLYHSLNHKLKL